MTVCITYVMQLQPEITAEKRRKLHQSELAAQMHEEAKVVMAVLTVYYMIIYTLEILNHIGIVY